MKLWCFDDAHNWGSQLAKKARGLGLDAHLFNEPGEPDIGYVFFHMHHHPQTRIYHKRAMAVMALNPQLILIPDYRSSVLYDDRLEQARQLARWTPRTRIFYAPGRARSFVDRTPTYPFISKSSEGSNGHNVRVIRTPEEARLEIRNSFADIGIRTQYDQKQIGYLLWQDMVQGSVGDVRVLAVGKSRLIMKRGRVSTPVAELTAETEMAMYAANDFFREEGIGWGGVDLIYDKLQSRWLVLGLTVGWNMPAYYECQFYREGKATGRTGLEVWDVLLAELAAGSFL